jgi:hypothetical protein
MPDLEEMIRLLKAVVAAGDKERAANSNEARAAAQAEALATENALDDATGRTDRRRRRMIAEAKGLPLGTKVDAADFEQFALDCLDGTPSGLIRLRHIYAQYAVDGGHTLTPPLSGLLASNMLQTAKGHEGPLDGPVRASGVDLNGGPADIIRDKIVGDTGYTIGVEIGGTGRLPHKLWKRAERAQHALAQKMRMSGEKAESVRFRTIKDWCLKSGPLADLFQDARKDGARERRAPNSDRILPVWREPGGSSL